MLIRLETMMLTGYDMPIIAIRQQIAAAIDIVVHLSRLRDYSRRVLEISEIVGMKEGEICLKPLFVFKEEENQQKEKTDIYGELVKVGEISQKQKLLQYGVKREG